MGKSCRNILVDIRRILFLLVVVGLCLPLTIMPAFASTDKENYEEASAFWKEDYSNHFFGNQLKTSAEVQLYQALERDIFSSLRGYKSRIVHFDNPIILPSNTSFDNQEQLALLAAQGLQRAMDAFRFDHPEMYWVTGGSAITDISIGLYENGEIAIISASGTFYPSHSNFIADDINISNEINRLVSEAFKVNGDFYRLQYVHNSLAKSIKYDTNTPPLNRSHQIAGGLVDGQGVCESYAKIFKLVAERLGYETVLVGGVGSNQGQAIPHMWNYVKVQGQWYGVDITWDDQGITMSDYLLVGRDTPSPNFSSTFGASHVEEYVFYPIDYEAFYYPTLASGMLNRAEVSA